VATSGAAELRRGGEPQYAGRDDHDDATLDDVNLGPAAAAVGSHE